MKSNETGSKIVNLLSKASLLCLTNTVENTKIKVITNMWKILWELYLQYTYVWVTISLHSFHVSYSWKANSSLARMFAQIVAQQKFGSYCSTTLLIKWRNTLNNFTLANKPI